MWGKGRAVAMPEGVSQGWGWSRRRRWSSQNPSFICISGSARHHSSPFCTRSPAASHAQGVSGQRFVKFKTKVNERERKILPYSNSLRFGNRSAQVTQTQGDGEILLLVPLQMVTKELILIF